MEQRTEKRTEQDREYRSSSEGDKGKEGKNRASILEATEVVDLLDNDALCALTVAHTVASLIPTAGQCSVGLDTLETIFDKLVYCERRLDSVLLQW